MSKAKYLDEQKIIVIVWGALILLSLFSWMLMNDVFLLFDETDTKVSSMAIIVLSFVKVRLIVRHYMEVKLASGLIKAFFDVWVIGVGALLCGLYWVG